MSPTLRGELRCGVVGAGRTRNGLGPFLARFVEAAGGTVVGVAGRTDASAAAAAAALAAEFGHPVGAHGSVDALLESGLDALVIAAPDAAHLPALQLALTAGVATLCEKPLVTAEQHAAVGPLVAGYRERGLLLQENCQWPLVLPAFQGLFGRLPDAPAEIAMRLSPMAPGPDMLRGSLSHLLSVIQALIPIGATSGDGAEIAVLRFAGRCGVEDGLTTTFVLRDPASGWPDVTCRLDLAVCEAQPRPAWLQIDGHRMERVVEMPSYDISFVAGEKRISTDDPTRTLVYRFVEYAREASIERNRIEVDRIGQRARLYSEIVHRLDRYLPADAGHRREEAIHHFTAKLRQPGMLPTVVDYVAWQRALQKARADGLADPVTPDLVPLSINLDLTVACNYKCDHCIDWDILNTPVKHADDELRSALQLMAQKGLRSVILIGGGEPTLYPGFVSFVEFLKGFDLAVSIVTNGSRGDKLLEIAPMLTKGDWIRLSLDSGSNTTFQKMHNPSKKSLTLDEICAWMPKIRAANPDVDLGYSFIVTWRGGMRDDCKIIENIDEIVSATRRARDAEFSYIAFKPFLERKEDGAEVMDPSKTEDDLRSVRERIIHEVDEAKKLEREGFRVMESTNLRVLEEGRWDNLRAQPRTCHMQALRQVLTPLGTFNCPAYRGVDYAKLGAKDAYKDSATARDTAEGTKTLLDNFDASHNCREITCLYNDTNWWMQDLIDSDRDLSSLEESPDRRDFFL